MKTIPFSFKRPFASQQTMQEIENKISLSKTIDIAMSCIPTTFPDYLQSEIKEQITRFFSK